jgi:hypothetical protein
MQQCFRPRSDVTEWHGMLPIPRGLAWYGMETNFSPNSRSVMAGSDWTRTRLDHSIHSAGLQFCNRSSPITLRNYTFWNPSLGMKKSRIEA